MGHIYKEEELAEEELLQIAKEVENGKIVVFKTETIYGIGTNAYNKASCRKIFDIKERSLNNPLLVLISNYDMLRDIAREPNELERKLMDTFWPGPLTIILTRKEDDKVFKSTEAIGDEIGIRMTSNPFLHSFLEAIHTPITAPSANITGQVPDTKVENVIKTFQDKVDYIIDSGDVESPISSTIVKVEDGVIEIQREGRITKERLREIGPIKESHCTKILTKNK